jgi:hypothetical protein
MIEGSGMTPSREVQLVLRGAFGEEAGDLLRPPRSGESIPVLRECLETAVR